ncbi:amino acid permease [Lichenicola sp.]|uniref:amino acid permease n=1 Tax=Lichenicola sp. TaxID=2804529 RepID=UPI003B00203C
MQHAPRGLTRRHVEFLTLGGTIGGGLFLGVGQGIRAAGPAMILAFLAAGCAVFVVARCLGETALAVGGRATFVRTTRLNLGPRVAFIGGWSYWACTVLTCMAELVGAGILLRVWLPALPPWVAALPALVLLSGLNRMRVRVFGEIEFWMAMLKVVACVAIVVLGLMLAADPARRPEVGIDKLWVDGGFLPNGWRGLLLALPAAVFAFGGSELVGLASADAEQPAALASRVGRAILIRTTVIYVGVTTALLVVMPWRTVSVANSPFVDFLARVGLPGSSTVMAVVVLSAILSSGNACLYGATRVLASLAEEGLAPPRLGLRNDNGAPGAAVTVSSCLVAVAIGLELLVPGRLFVSLLTMSAITGLANWAIFTITHLRSIRHRQGRAKTDIAWISGNVAVLALIGVTVAVVATGSGTRPAVLAVALLFGTLTVAAFLLIPARSADRERSSVPCGR